MSEVEWKSIMGVLLTSEPIPAYGGTQIPAETLRELAAALGSDALPMHLDHDLTKPLRIRGFKAFVEQRGDGIDELRFQAEIHEDDLQHLEVRRGMSATLTAPLDRDALKEPNRRAVLHLSADHAWFDDQVLIEAESRLADHGVDRNLLRVERAYQFSYLPDPQIFVTIVLPLFVSIGASAIWDGVKMIFGRRRTPPGGHADTATIVNLSITDGDRSLTASVRTNDAGVAQTAIESLDEVAETFFGQPGSPARTLPAAQKSVTTWDEGSGRWSPPT